MNKILADNVFGTVEAPGSAFGERGTAPETAIANLIQTVIWVLIIGAGIYALFNLVLAGYSFMSAGDDSKKVAGAWGMIYQTMIGLAFSAGAFVWLQYSDNLYSVTGTLFLTRSYH